MKKLDIHISDIVEKIDLKIFEEDIKDKTIFTFEFNDSRDNSEIILKLEEKVGNIFLTFVNIDTGKVNVIFKLKDSNNYGIIEPES